MKSDLNQGFKGKGSRQTGLEDRLYVSADKYSTGNIILYRLYGVLLLDTIAEGYSLNQCIVLLSNSIGTVCGRSFMNKQTYRFHYFTINYYKTQIKYYVYIRLNYVYPVSLYLNVAWLDCQ